MAKFIVQQNRKPWNKGVEFLYQTIQTLTDPAACKAAYYGPIPQTIPQLYEKLTFVWKYQCENDPKLKRLYSGIDIKIWNDNKVMGINKAKSVDGAALVVTMEEE